MIATSLAQLTLVLGVTALLPRVGLAQVPDKDSVTEVAVFNRLKAAVAANDRRGVAAQFVYPVRVNRSARRYFFVETRAELLRRYDAILTPYVRRAILTLNSDSLFHSWRGSMVGNGAVWIDGICEDDRAQKCRFGVVAINLSPPH